VLGRPGGEQRVPVDVVEVLQWALRVTGPQVRHRARLSSELQPVPRVMATEVWLGRVFVNLLVNAAQAISPGAEEQNEVQVRCGTAPDGRVSVAVSDTGGGIPAERLDQLFTPYFTGARTPGAGAGLSLSVSHTLVTALGGEIRVRSVMGHGSTFEVLLPAIPGPQEAPALPEATPEPAPPLAAGAAAGRARLLVVDDEALVGRAIKRVLGRRYEVVTLDDPLEALRLVEAGERFDALLCDMMMPGMSGMDLHDRLKELAPALAERTIFLTGGAFTGAARQFLDAVANARVEKPFDARALESVVDAVLGKK